MIYTHSITSKGQITLPKEFRDKLGLKTDGQAQISLNAKNQIVVSAPMTLQDVRASLAVPTHKDPLTTREATMGADLAKKYGVR